MTRSRFAAALAAASLVLAAAAPTAGAASTYCSPTGDLCYGKLARSPVKLRITLAAEYFERYRLCVTGPDGGRDCKRFSVRRQPSGVYESTVRWSRHFPNRGHGIYRARWFSGGRALGPRISYRR